MSVERVPARASIQGGEYLVEVPLCTVAARSADPVLARKVARGLVLEFLERERGAGRHVHVSEDLPAGPGWEWLHLGP